MYFANMYSYGRSTDGKVGITPIRGCMGIIYFGNLGPYAIHIPPTNDNDEKAGREAFAHYVSNNEGISLGSGSLFAFVNGRNRPNADAEMQHMKQLLNNPPTTIYRIKKHLGPDSGRLGAESPAIMMEHSQPTKKNGSGCFGFYKKDGSVTWVKTGEPRAGFYGLEGRADGFQSNQIPSNFGDWYPVEKSDNCNISNI
jgi:hypothetical protein